MRVSSLMLSLTVVGAMAMPLLYAAPAHAQATRTWVSGVGDDANPCSRTAPCKTWAGAISKTAPGGEIDALDPGGFGALTITKSITLDGGGGQVASTLVAGTNGIVVSVAAADVVILRNLRFDGLLGNGGNSANAGINGIRHIQAGTLIVDNCDIFGFNTNGIDVAPTSAAFVAINNTRIENVANAGIRAAGVAGTQVQVDNVRLYKTKFGVVTQSGNTIVMSRSVSSFANVVGGGGVEADGGSTLVLDNNVISFNATAFVGGSQSFGNNKVFGNTAEGTTPTLLGGGTVTNPVGMQ